MGSNEDIMHDFVRKELKRLYPTVDGWQIKPAPKIEGKEQGFVVSRRLLGRSEGSFVLVSFDNEVTPDTIEHLKSIEKSGQMASVAKPGRILVVPKGSNTSNVPDDIRIIQMQSFGFDGKELIWLKRRAQMSEKVISQEST
ncbi:MAG TPA: hypothetical protein VMW63_10445 [Methanoregulaceae archaeon]|nr:hypothetical protein [Methanoregulaceae archaeon]